MIKIRGLVDEDFVNYKKPAMFIAFPYCTFKCDKECGYSVCQNSSLVTNSEIIDIDEQKIVNRYIDNPITTSIVISGLEPFDSYQDLFILIKAVREKTLDDIVIYTGYNKNEIENNIEELKQFKNIFVKFGRFIPNQQKHYDNILQVNLASPNQYGEKIS